MLNQVTPGIKANGMVTVLSSHERVRRPVTHVIFGAASVVAWLGLALMLGLEVLNSNGSEERRLAFLAKYQWELTGVIILAATQSLLIITLLMERRARLTVESKKTEHGAELMHTSRLAVVGQLSASIGHEINQPLGAIISNADAVDFMLANVEPNLDEIRLILADIRKDSLRASQIIRQVQTLARKRPLDIKEVNLQDMCRDVLHLIIPIARRRGVSILTRFDPQELLVRGDAVLLQQAMLNLLLNAMDALVDVPDPRAVIELTVALSGPEEIEVMVRDHGNGMSEQHLNQLFNAFFTSKIHGLGLGLPIVRSIIESHGGRISAKNHPEGGALFCFTIPAVIMESAANYATGEQT